MITVHHLNESRSQRILWLLEELEVPYDIQFYRRDERTRMAPAELQRVHPLGSRQRKEFVEIRLAIGNDDNRAAAVGALAVD